jgi:hypothetical protein
MQLIAQAAPAVAGSFDPVSITLVGGVLVSIITTIGGVIVSVITALHVRQIAGRQVENASAIGQMARDTEAIKGHVNSEKTAADGREMTLRRENDLLREMVANANAAAGLLAQAAATRSRLEPFSAPAAAAASLENIETNTAETAAGVKDLNGVK